MRNAKEHSLKTDPLLKPNLSLYLKRDPRGKLLSMLLILMMVPPLSPYKLLPIN